jgi:hypothetical protein
MEHLKLKMALLANNNGQSLACPKHSETGINEVVLPWNFTILRCLQTEPLPATVLGFVKRGKTDFYGYGRDDRRKSLRVGELRLRKLFSRTGHFNHLTPSKRTIKIRRVVDSQVVSTALVAKRIACRGSAFMFVKAVVRSTDSTESACRK